MARRMWLALEPIHSTVYFAAEAKPVYEEAGLKGYWMGYFASRSAAFGPASAELVMATFYNFAERMVRRAIPDAWRFSTPERVREARLRIADMTTRRLVGDPSRDGVPTAAEVAEAAARAARPEGRALFAAHAALPWPSEPHLRLWHAATLLREHRGDGHVAVLIANGIDGLEAHVLAAAAGRIEIATQKQSRGITDDEWAAASERLHSRGFVDSSGAFTPEGRAFKQTIEDRTDELALQPYEAIGAADCERLLETVGALVSEPGVPYPNPIGLTRPPR
jgi:hypothetical protein